MMIALLDQFKKELAQVKEFADSTVENYVTCIALYCQFAKETLHIDPVYSKGVHLLKWLARVRTAADLSASRMQHHQSALVCFFELLCKLRLIRKNPAQSLPPIRRIRSEKNKPVSKSVVNKLLKSVDRGNWIGKRNYLIIAMLWALGLRVSELTALRVKHFEPGHDNKIGLLRVRGKNKKQRALFVVDRLYDTLIDYLGDPGSPWKKNAPLLPIQTDAKAVSNNRVLKMIKEQCEKAGIKKRITPHVLRHCFATELYHAGVPIEAIVNMMGHSHKAESAVYIHVSDRLQKQALEKIIIEGRLSWLY